MQGQKRALNRFNLTFSGQIQKGETPDDVKLRFAQKFAIDDPQRLDRFFSGKQVILRRNLGRKEAAECYQDMQRLGMVTELVRVAGEEEDAEEIAATPPTADRSADPGPLAGNKEQDQPSAHNKNNGSTAPPARNPEQPITTLTDARTTEEVITVTQAKAKKPGTEAAKERNNDQPLESDQTAANEADAARLEAEQHVSVTAKKAAGQSEQLQAPLQQPATKTAEKAPRQVADEAQRLRKENDRERAAKERLLAEQDKLTAEREAAKKATGQARKDAKAEAQRLRREHKQELAKLKAEERKERRNQVKEEKQHLQAEKKAREKAERERTKAQEKTEKTLQALKDAKEAARHKLAEEKERHRQAEKTVREEARKREQERLAAETRARTRAETKLKRAEQARQAAEQAAEEEAQRARTEQEQAEQARSEARELARRNADLERERTIIAQKAAQLEAELVAQRQALEADVERARQAAAQALARQAREEQDVERSAGAQNNDASLKPARASIRTSMDLPQRRRDTIARKRQAGEPNLYALRPFRNRPEVQQRANTSAAKARRYGVAGALVLAVLLALAGTYLSHTPQRPVTSVSALASTPGGEVVLLAGDALYLHDRSGTSGAQHRFADLGVASLSPPLAYENPDSLLVAGQLLGSDAEQLLRCDLQAGQCAALPDLPAQSRPTALAVQTLSGQVLLVDEHSGELVKTDAQGKVLARATPALPPQPYLVLEAGLLMVNSSEAPAISVLRYDDEAFGQQLDEILLLPPEALSAGQSRVADFLHAAGTWWVTLFNPDSGDAGLYRFDTQWNYLGQVPIPLSSADLQLARLGDKTLVNTRRSTSLARYSPEGLAEVPLTSKSLEQQLGETQRQRQFTETAWRVALIGCGLATLAALALALLQYLRGRVYRPGGERGAQPVDDYLEQIQWVDHAADRHGALRNRRVGYGLLAVAVILLAIWQQASTLQLAALLLLLTGPAVALALFARRSPGHIGRCQEQLLLVEPSGLYHMDHGPRVLRGGGFLFIDDVAVFTGNALLPAFDAQQTAALAEPVTASATRIDTSAMLVRLLQSGHPLAQGTVAIAVFTLGALALLLMQGIF